MNSSVVRPVCFASGGRCVCGGLDSAARLGAATIVAACLLLTACQKSEAPAPNQTTTSGEGAGTGITATPSGGAKGENAPTMGIGSGAPNPPGAPSATPGGAGTTSGGAGQMPPQDSHVSAPSGGAEADTAKNKK